MPQSTEEPVWRKSERSNPSGNCVEVANLGQGIIGLRDSKHPRGAVLTCSRKKFAAMLLSIKHGDFDGLGRPA